MADNLTTPVPDGKVLAFKDLAGVFYALNMLTDLTGADVLGLVTSSPNAQSVLGRLKGIQDLLTTQAGYVDGLETLNGLLNGYVDGLETLIGATNTALAAATPAGENYVGKQGGDILIVSQSPTVSASPAYASGDVIGALMTFSNIVRGSGLVGLVQLASVFCKTAQSTAVDLLLFNASPSASTITDNAAFVLNSADYGKVLGVVPITTWSALGTPSIGINAGSGLPVKPGTGTALYGVLVARGAITLGSTSDITVNLGVIPG